MAEASEYTYRVFWSSEDEEFVGTCAEFPLLSYCGDDIAETLAGIVDVVASALGLLQEEGREAPEPYGARLYSGKLLVRMPPELHRQLAMAAASEGVSLNHLITERLAAGVNAA